MPQEGVFLLQGAEVKCDVLLKIMIRQLEMNACGKQVFLN